MTENEARVAIAKDVLDHLNMLEVIWGGVYVNHRTVISNGEDAQKNIDFITNGCTVCALGACMLSYARLFNNLKTNELIHAHTHLKKYFTVRQLHLIEETFEGWCGETCPIFFTFEEKAAMSDLHNNYDDPKSLLQAIMKNIIENDGTFIP